MIALYFLTLAVGATVAGLIGNAWGVPIGLCVHFSLFRLLLARRGQHG